MMDYYDQHNYYTNLGYVDYPKQDYYTKQNNYDYSNTDTVLYSSNCSRSIPTNYVGNYNDTSNYPNRVNMSSELEEALNMIKDSIMAESEDEMFYTTLINQAIEEEDKTIIRMIRDDEMRHNQILRDLYYTLTGITLPQPKQDNDIPAKSYLGNLKKALMGEMEAAGRYRKIMNAMPDKKSILDISGIIIDELRHGNKYNYLITKTMHSQPNMVNREVDTEVTTNIEVEAPEEMIKEEK